MSVKQSVENSFFLRLVLVLFTQNSMHYSLFPAFGVIPVPQIGYNQTAPQFVLSEPRPRFLGGP